MGALYLSVQTGSLSQNPSFLMFRWFQTNEDLRCRRSRAPHLFFLMNRITTVDDEVSWGDFIRHRLWCCFSLCGGKRRLNELQIYRIWILWVRTQTYHQVFTTVSHSRRWCDVKLPISQSAACVVQHFGGTEVQQKEREMSKILKTAEE